MSVKPLTMPDLFDNIQLMVEKNIKKSITDTFDSLDIFDKIQLKVEEAIENGNSFNIKELYDALNSSNTIQSKYIPLTNKYIVGDIILEDDFNMIVTCSMSLTENDMKFIHSIHTKKYKLSEAQIKWLNGIIGRCKRTMTYLNHNH